MSDNIPSRHSDDAHSDDAAPTDAVTDEVREAAASAEDHADANGPRTGSDADSPAGPNADADEVAAAQTEGSEEQGDA